MDIEDQIIHGSVLEQEITQKLAGKKFSLSFLGHGLYYLYKGKAKEVNRDLSRQTDMIEGVDLSSKYLSDKGIAILLHQSLEYTNIIKRKFGKTTESDTTEVLHDILQSQSTDFVKLDLAAKLQINLSGQTKTLLSARKLEPYSRTGRKPIFVSP